ncbi:MAG: VIT domain-containing protein [Methyloligellaceae bacterium]
MKSRRVSARSCNGAADLLAGLLLFSLVFVLAFAAPRAAWPGPVSTAAMHGGAGTLDATRLHPANMRTGTLLLTPKASLAGKRAVIEARRIGTDIDVSVTGPIVRTTMTQRFRVPNLGQFDGTYVLPLAEGATVDGLRAVVGARVIEGRIQPIQQAGRDQIEVGPGSGAAGGITARSSAIFTSRVHDIAAGQIVTMRITYQGPAERDGIYYSLRVPLIAEPRSDFVSRLLDGRTGRKTPSPASLGPRAGALGPVSLQVTLKAGFPLAGLDSRNHDVTIWRTGPSSAVLSLEGGAARGQRDFQLMWSPKSTTVPQITTFRERFGEHDYLLAMITPPTPGRTAQSKAREMIFVVDTSRSMAGDAIEQVKAGLTLALDRLGPADTFNIIRFGNDVAVSFKKPHPATPEAIAAAKQMVSGLSAEGATELLPALERALPRRKRGAASRARQIVLLTDGAVNDETRAFTEIASKRGGARIFAVGIGPARNATFLRRAAEIGRGSYTEAGSGWRGLERIRSLLRRLEQPVMTGLRVAWAAGVRPDVSPDPLPDLHAGEPIVLAARLPSLKGDMTVAGAFHGKTWKAVLKLQDATRGDGIAKFWARRKIAALDARRYAGQDRQTVDGAIADVALQHHIVGRMTRLVAVELEPEGSPARPGETVSAWPASAMDRRLPEMPSARKKTIGKAWPAKRVAPTKVASARPFAGPFGIGRDGSAAARNASFFNRSILVLVVAVFFAAMCAVTLGLWRHLGREYVPSRRPRSRI